MSNPSRSEIVGHTIKGILRTPWSKPTVIAEGLGAAVYCDIIFELSTGQRFSVFYGDISVSSEPPYSLQPLEPELRPSGNFGLIRALVVDQWDALYIVTDDGYYFHVDPGGFSGFGCYVAGGSMQELRMVDGVPRVFRDYWSGESVDVYARDAA